MILGNIKRKTKHYLLMGLLSTLSGVTFAQSYYEFIRYRSNDPFVFCTQGYKEIPAQACWVPVAPYLGQWMYTGVCRPPNKYGRNWDFEDHDSLSQYERICPHAMQSGTWEGRTGGLPQMTPFKH